MKISVIGTGYVGLVTGACLADFGHNVICMDKNINKIEKLNLGEIPIFEPGLKEIIERNKYYKRISFTTKIENAIKESDIIYIAVGTPSKKDGSANLEHIIDVAYSIGNHMNSYKIIVNKSTVPVETGKKVEELIKKCLQKRNKKINFDVVSNPEFLREGKAVYDFTHPDRIVIGTENNHAKNTLKKVYNVLFLNNTPFIFCNRESSELIKYASNSFLAVKISFINEISLLAEKVGANIQDVSKAMGMDGRISSKFLHAGPGYGGSCFPKDTKAICDIALKKNIKLNIINAAIDANYNQKINSAEKIILEMENSKEKIITLLGLSFKPNTDDIREAPSLTIIRKLLKANFKIKAFCPQGMKAAKKIFANENNIQFYNDEYEAATNSYGIAIITEWHQFRAMNLEKIASVMNDKYFFDFRNIYSNDNNITSIFHYFGTGTVKKKLLKQNIK